MEYFTTKRSLFLVPSNNCDEEFRKIDKYIEILEKSQVGKILEKVYKNDKKTNVGRKGYNPFNMFVMVTYCFTKFKSSLREMEELCKYDLRIIYIMEQQIPNYTIIGDFINKYILPYQYKIFFTITKQIIIDFNFIISDQYVDGTKLEANANKYKFVFKSTTFYKRLDKKIKEFINNNINHYCSNKLIKSYEFDNILKRYVQDKK